MSPELLSMPAPAVDSAPKKPSYSDRVKSLRLGSTEARETSVRKQFLTLLGWSVALAASGTSLLLGYKVFREPAVVTVVASPDTRPAGNTSRTSSDRPVAGATAPPTVAPPTSPEALVLENKGYVIPVHLILVSPKVGGMVTRMNFKEGDLVPKDFVLAELETIDYLADVQRADAMLHSVSEKYAELRNGARKEEKDQAELELQEARRQLTQLELELVRSRRLSGTAAVLSAREMEQAQYQYEGQDQRVKRLTSVWELIKIGPRPERIRAAEAEVRQYEAELSKARWRLSNCTIKAPVSGMILSKKAEEGNIVNPGAFNGSFSLCEMADLSNLEVELDIQERDISKVRDNQLCQVMPEAWQSDAGFLATHPRGYVGFVSRIMPQANRSKGAIPVRVKIVIPKNEQGRYLKPDMGAMVTFFNDVYRDAPVTVSAPKEAAQP